MGYRRRKMQDVAIDGAGTVKEEEKKPEAGRPSGGNQKGSEE